MLDLQAALDAELGGDAWDTSVPDWEDRIREGRSLIPDLPLHDGNADKALRIFKRLRVPDLPGKPTFGEVCDDWVFDFVRAVFGSYDPETKRRMIKEFFLLVPKKNGKSAISSGIIVTAAIMNDWPQAELYLIAPTQKIAKITFKTAAGIIAADEEGQLQKLFHVRHHENKITHLGTEAEIAIVSADGDVVTGSKGAYVLVDETHVLGAKAKAPEIFIELRGGLKSRPQGFFLQITTQSKKPPIGQFATELNNARDVRDGKTRQPMLAVLYEFPKDMIEAEAWRDPATWHLVNPNLGRSVQLADLIIDMQKAENEGEEDVALFVSQHLNVEVGLGLRKGAWTGAYYWEDAAEPGLWLDRILETSEVVTVGIDGGGLDDLLGLSVLGRRPDGVFQHWGRAWAHREVLNLRKSIAQELLDLQATGDLVFVNSLRDATAELVEICESIQNAGLFPEKHGIGLDPEGITSIVRALMQVPGFTMDDVAAVSQGWKLNAAIKTTPDQLFDGQLVHCGQKIMSFSVGNAKTEARGNAVLVTKAQSGTAKIDPLMALFNSVMLMSWHPEAANANKGIEIDADYWVA